MGIPKVYADFQNLDDLNRLRLTAAGTLQDLERQGIQLHEGLLLTSEETPCPRFRSQARTSSGSLHTRPPFSRRPASREPLKARASPHSPLCPSVSAPHPYRT
jgi:hypothetical protein